MLYSQQKVILKSKEDFCSIVDQTLMLFWDTQCCMKRTETLKADHEVFNEKDIEAVKSAWERVGVLRLKN